MPGRFCLLTCLTGQIATCLLLCCLAGCGDTPEASKTPETVKQAERTGVAEQPTQTAPPLIQVIQEKNTAISPTPSVSSTPAPDAAALARADAVLAFHNRAVQVLDTGWFSLPDILYRQINAYFETWQLLPRPRMQEARATARAALIPPAALFSQEDTAQLDKAVERMDKALGSILADYRAMSRYVADSRIRDDGARGRSLAASIRKDYAVFMAAREQWLEVVGAQARVAESLVLHGHPLHRQITGAAQIFTLFDRAARLLQQEDRPDRAALLGVRDELATGLALCGKPPFQGRPGQERLYRLFLAEARQFVALLEDGLREGFYDAVRAALNTAQRKSRLAYNAFAAAVAEGQDSR